MQGIRRDLDAAIATIRRAGHGRHRTPQGRDAVPQERFRLARRLKRCVPSQVQGVGGIHVTAAGDGVGVDLEQEERSCTPC